MGVHYICILKVLCLFLEFGYGLSQHIESLSKVRCDTEPSTQEDAARALIQRTIGGRSNEFNVIVNPQISKDERDVFKIFKSAGSKVVDIEGSSGVAVAWGFHHYLKYFCNCHVSWNDDQLNLPPVLPPVDVHITANDRWRYYQNVCTTSYSFVWWGWQQWERHIDWMALNGINLALAFSGQEAIWQRVYSRLNMTAEEVDEHFTGPAFFSWGRMGNIRGWSGPLSDAWHKNSLVLQKLILARMRALGITPVLPAFAGHVPHALKRLYPNVNFTLATRWNKFEDKYCCPFLLSPEDPLFKTIGSMFLEEMIKEFGTNHIYNCDTFNEMPPAEGDTNFLKKVGESIFESMTQVDPDAVWMLQGWIFFNERVFWTKDRAKALLTSVPVGKMLVLDLMSELNPQFERLNSYFGQPYIWCMLLNFGGTLGMHGTAKRVNENVFKARNTTGSSMVGIGLTMEGIHQNYVMYDLMMEMGWRDEPSDLTQWFRNYSSRRYGQDNEHLDRSWQLLKGSVYEYISDAPNFSQYILVRHPTINLTDPVPVWYNTTAVMEAWDEVLSAADADASLAETATFRHDLTDLSRQALQLCVDFMYRQVQKAFVKKDLTCLRNASSTFLAIMEDLNTLLASNKWFLLGRWLESAKLRASSPQERRQFELMARNQITLWGPNGEIKDYACKQWADLMENYYIPRWEYFFKALEKAVVDKTPFNQTSVDSYIFTEIEKPFTFGQELYPTFEIDLMENYYIPRWKYFFKALEKAVVDKTPFSLHLWSPDSQFNVFANCDTIEISRRLHKTWRRLENHYIPTNCSNVKKG